MEEDIIIVKELLQGAKDNGMYDNNKYFYSIENLIKGYKREKEDNERWEKHCNDLEEQITELNNKTFELEYNTVPKSKVKEKIEELDEEYKQMESKYEEEVLDAGEEDLDDYIEMEKIRKAKRVLKELMEDK